MGIGGRVLWVSKGNNSHRTGDTAFLAKVTGRGHKREGFLGFLHLKITVTERAIAHSVDCECSISDTTLDSLRVLCWTHKHPCWEVNWPV